MTKIQEPTQVNLRVYKGYGHAHHLVLYGHLLHGSQALRERFTHHLFYNARHLFRLFNVHPIAGARIQLNFEGQIIETTTKEDGFFEFHWKADRELPAGHHPLSVAYLTAEGEVLTTENGEVYIPHAVQQAVISDIDDTILISYSSRMFRRLRVLFTRQPRSRKTFEDIVHYFRLLALSNTSPELPNPFFYVSSSEWNLYDDLTEFFSHNKLPAGVLLLNKIKRWHQLGSTGQTQHELKLKRIRRILEMFPLQRFILYGDNSQHDPMIYLSVAKEFPDNIIAIYIRSVNREKEVATKALLSSLDDSPVHALVFRHTREAMLHSAQIGLISVEAANSSAKKN